MTAITKLNVAEPRVLSCGSGSQGAYAREQNPPTPLCSAGSTPRTAFFLDSGVQQEHWV